MLGAWVRWVGFCSAFCILAVEELCSIFALASFRIRDPVSGFSGLGV